MKFLHSRSLSHLYISNDEYISINKVLKKYEETK